MNMLLSVVLELVITLLFLMLQLELFLLKFGDILKEQVSIFEINLAFICQIVCKFTQKIRVDDKDRVQGTLTYLKTGQVW